MSRPTVIALVAALALVATAPASAAPPAERALYDDGPSGRHLLDSGWTTRADPANAGLRERWQRPGRDAGFRRVSVPHAFNARTLDRDGFRSRVQWYRLRFELPLGRDATGWKLRFESVANRGSVWLNGRRLGSHEGAHLPFELAAVGARRRGANELVVRVDGREGRTDIPPAGRDRGWWNYGGLLREVYLRRVGQFDLADLQVDAVPGVPAQGIVRAVVRNTTRQPLHLPVQLDISGPGGFTLSEPLDFGNIRPGGLARIERLFEIPAAHNWSPESPELYALSLTVPGGQVTRTHFGVRNWQVDRRGGVFLNGRPLSLRGASFHEDAPRVGAALRPSQLDGIAGSLAALGADFTRQHYPPHPRLLEAFDRMGIVMWEQIPVYRLRGSHLRSGRLRREALARLRQTIIRDRNHASIMTWSIGNELLRGGPAERRYIEEARRLIDRLDRTRLVGIDKSISPVDQVPAHYRLLDVLGLSGYLGWYAGRTSDLRASLDELRARFPRVGLFLTEFGAEASRAGPASQKGTYAFQTSFLDSYLATADSTPYLNGACAWLLRDYAVRPGWRGGNPRPDPPYSRKGLIDLAGGRKPAFELVRQRFEGVPSTRAP